MFELPDAVTYRDFFASHKFVVVPDFLPPEIARDWALRAEALSAQRGVSILRPGEHKLAYIVVDGKLIRKHWPALYRFYGAEQVRAWVAAVTGETAIFTSAHEASAININRLESTEHIYRWHYDAVPYTLLVYLSDSVPDDGGALEVRRETGEVIQIYPRRGLAVLMDGTRCEHHAAPLLRQVVRLSMPMVFPANRVHARPTGLDDYLYK